MPDKHIIPKSAFQYSLFREYEIPEGIREIGDYGFYQCVLLEAIRLPDSVHQLGVRVFSNCRKLRSVKLSRSLTAIPYATFLNCMSLEEICIPAGIREIGDYAFQRCTSIKQLTFPEGLHTLGRGSFSDCTSLTEVILPQGVTELKFGAFAGCTALQRVVIPKSVHTIHHYAFSGCSNLTQIVCPNPERFAESLADTPYWQKHFPNISVRKHLPLVLTGAHMGEYLIRRGYSHFKADREYYIDLPGEDGVVQVRSWCGEDGPDEDGFGREEYYDWWLLDEQLKPIPGIPMWHSYSRLDMRNHEKKWAALREKAARILQNRRK